MNALTWSRAVPSGVPMASTTRERLTLVAARRPDQGRVAIPVVRTHARCTIGKGTVSNWRRHC